MADDNIRHVNCASDFRIVFAFSGGKLPDYPWRLGLKTPNTPSYNMYVASFDGTTYNNCSPLDDESIMVFVDHHRLAPGILHYYLQTDAPDSLFPDGEMNVTIPGTVNIELWEGPSDGDTPPEVTVIVERLLKGDKGDPGDPGEAGQITSATASVDNTTGTPSVKIELGGTPEKRTIDLKFSGLKGEPGEPDESFVRYDEEQSLTDTQKDTVLSNIGLGFVIVDYSELLTPLSDDRLSKLVNAKGVILTNTPDNYTRSVVFTAGTRLVNSITFSSVEDAQNINYIVLNIPNKVLSLVQTIKLVISDSNQNLSNTQKDTVLSNIGLNWIHVQYSLLGTTLDDATYTKLTNAYGIILTDVPSDYFGPREFICGANNSDGTKVFAGLNLANTSAYIVLYANHRLSTVRYLRTYDGAVPYDASKALTSAQQAVARTNIGVKSADELLADDDFIAQLKTKLGIG
jgi:hypothetical protein